VKFIVQFKVHVAEAYRDGLLNEIGDSSGASYTTRADGLIVITDYGNSDENLIKSFLTDEDERGTLRYWLEE